MNYVFASSFNNLLKLKSERGGPTKRRGMSNKLEENYIKRINGEGQLYQNFWLDLYKFISNR